MGEIDARCEMLKAFPQIIPCRIVGLLSILRGGDPSHLTLIIENGKPIAFLNLHAAARVTQ